MKLTSPQIERMCRRVLAELQAANVLVLKVPLEKVVKAAIQRVNEDFEREKRLESDVYKMMDELEKKNPGEFQRHKMFPLLKARLAKEKGIIL